MFVESLSDIEDNVDTLIDAIHSDSQDRQKFADWVKAGAVFYPYQFGRVIAFAPSRFIGYKANSRENHEGFVANGTAHGWDTNSVISKIVGSKPKQDDRLELAFQRYCSSIGVVPYNKKRTYWANDRIIYAFNSQFSAIDDLDETEVGNDSPEKRTGTNTFFARDPDIRRQVRTRANGRCELCGELGFERGDGSRFVEVHHIIHLSKQGPDTLDNVIALCPNHHREAHFGKDGEKFEEALKTKLRAIRGK